MVIGKGGVQFPVLIPKNFISFAIVISPYTTSYVFSICWISVGLTTFFWKKNLLCWLEKFIFTTLLQTDYCGSNDCRKT